MLVVDVVFWVLSAAAIGAALGVVLVKDLFRAALFLVVVFITVAGLFVMLSAEFLAVVQVLIYAGAIAILIIFAVMLTRDVQHGNLPNRIQIPAVALSALLLAAMVWTAVQTPWNLIEEGDRARVDLVQTGSVSVVTDEDLAAAGFDPRETGAVRKAGLADLLIGDFVLPFEAVSVLLLAAVIGALALVRPRSEE
jgi:NADH-quinone oxidoreductase subunit J